MSLNEEVELLQKIPLFAKIEPSKLKLLAFTSERLTYEVGQHLCEQGEMGDAAFLIMEGEAEVTVEGPNGPITVAHVGANEIVGEIAILCDVRRTATVTASSRLIALKISKDMFFRLVRKLEPLQICGLEHTHDPRIVVVRRHASLTKPDERP